jgi:hypothetical protein
LGEKVLDDHRYKPDFTAKVQKKAKLLAISQSDYKLAKKNRLLD